MGVGEGLCGMIGKRRDTFQISSYSCLKGSREKPVLAVNVEACPLPAWVIRDQDVIF